MIWNESIECMDREQLREIQSIRLRKMVDYVYHNTPFYRKKFQEMDLTPGDIKGIEDIAKLPFTDKLDLRDNYPFGLAAVPMSQIVRIHASSGTTGKPVVVLHTRKDLAMWAESISRAFTSYGATKDDIFQVSYGYGLFTGGLGAHDGAQNIGSVDIDFFQFVSEISTQVFDNRNTECNAESEAVLAVIGIIFVNVGVVVEIAVVK